MQTAKEVALSLSRSLHDTVSSQLQKCVDSPASVGSSETLKTILAIGNSSQNSTQEAHSPLLTSASLTAAEVTVQFADQCLVLQGGDHPAGAGAGAAVWEDFQAKQRGNEEGEGGGADESGNTLKSCLFTACVTDSALLVLAHQYGDAGLQNFGATTDALYYYYCAAFSLDSLLQAMAKGEEGGDAEDSMDQDGSSTPYTTAHIRSSKMSLYNRPQPAGASSVSSATSSNISVLLALELNQCDEKLSGSGGDSSVFLLKIPLENVVFTPIRSSHAPSKPDLSLDTLAAVSRQAVSEDDFKCRQLPSLHSLGRVCARGERGVALVGDCAGKVVILDMEADDDEDDEDEEEEDYEVNGSEGEDREDADGSRKNQSAESSGADMSTSSS